MSVTLSSDGRVALVGGTGNGRPIYQLGGGVYVFTVLSEASWTTNSEPAALWNATYLGRGGDTLGWSTAISADDTTTLAGAYLGGGYANGAAYIYHAVPPNAGPPSKLVFSLDPAGATLISGHPFTVWVSVEDASGNPVVAGDPHTIKLAITPGTGNTAATLNCDANPATVAFGTAMFSCSLSKAGLGYTLTATAAGLTSAVSGQIDLYS
jgi:hypothetical protein